MYANSPWNRRLAAGAAFWRASAISIAPTETAFMPNASTMWGGLSISTSRPYALCHQSSSGAETTIARAPQMQTQAPSGPRKPQNETAAARSRALPANVVCSTSQPHDRPATTPPR